MHASCEVSGHVIRVKFEPFSLKSSLLNTKIHRKQRFPFKACLFSLAISDLTFTLASGSHYIVKLLNDATPLWVSIHNAAALNDSRINLNLYHAKKFHPILS